MDGEWKAHKECTNLSHDARFRLRKLGPPRRVPRERNDDSIGSDESSIDDAQKACPLAMQEDGEKESASAYDRGHVLTLMAPTDAVPCISLADSEKEIKMETEDSALDSLEKFKIVLEKLKQQRELLTDEGRRASLGKSEGFLVKSEPKDEGGGSAFATIAKCGEEKGVFPAAKCELRGAGLGASTAKGDEGKWALSAASSEFRDEGIGSSIGKSDEKVVFSAAKYELKEKGREDASFATKSVLRDEERGTSVAEKKRFFSVAKSEIRDEGRGASIAKCAEDKMVFPASKFELRDEGKGDSIAKCDEGKGVSYGAKCELRDEGRRTCVAKNETKKLVVKEETVLRKSKDCFWVNSRIYRKIGKIGSGGSSVVFKVISQDKIYALKQISLRDRDRQSAFGYYQEIEYLQRLRGKTHIIQLIDYEVSDKSIFAADAISEGLILRDEWIYMVLEYGEIDFAHMLERKEKEYNESGVFDENWMRLYWEHILKAVNTIHEERIVHADLKPANFLLVQGVLKLIDFGIAKSIQNDTTNFVQESQVGTVNYMSPEAFMTNSKCGRASDIWSLGCILYQMVYGRSPFSHLSFIQKVTEIPNPNHQIAYGPVKNPLLLDLMKQCLAWDKKKRPRIPYLLEHPFLRPVQLLHADGHGHGHGHDGHGNGHDGHGDDGLGVAILQVCKLLVSMEGCEGLRKVMLAMYDDGGDGDDDDDDDDDGFRNDHHHHNSHVKQALSHLFQLYIQQRDKASLWEMVSPILKR